MFTAFSVEECLFTFVHLCGHYWKCTQEKERVFDSPRIFTLISERYINHFCYIRSTDQSDQRVLKTSSGHSVRHRPVTNPLNFFDMQNRKRFRVARKVLTGGSIDRQNWMLNPFFFFLSIRNLSMVVCGWIIWFWLFFQMRRVNN